MLGVLLVFGHTRVRSHVSPGMDCIVFRQSFVKEVHLIDFLFDVRLRIQMIML